MKDKIVAFIFIFLFTSALCSANPVISTKTIAIESGFSPDGSAESVILNAINTSQASIRIAAYSFTSLTITKALIKAKKRGVDIAVIIDYEQANKSATKSNDKLALNRLVNARIAVRTSTTPYTQHNKYMVIDELHVQTGSYNYSVAAARYNHENVILIRNNRLLAQRYLTDWQTLYQSGAQYRST